MKLFSATMGPYKSLVQPQLLRVAEDVTVLVGQNEAGKTAILEALNKTRPVAKDAEFSVTEDYPRKDLSKYERDHQDGNTEVVRLTFALVKHEIESLRQKYGVPTSDEFHFSLDYRYNNKWYIDFNLDEAAAVAFEVSKAHLTGDLKESLKGVSTYETLAKALEDASLNEEEEKFRDALKTRLEQRNNTWRNLAAWEGYKQVSAGVPSFLYFGDYNTLPGKANLADLKHRRDNNTLRERDRAVLALFRMAGVDLDHLLSGQAYEETTARLEGFGNEVSDRVFEYWKQNRELDVRFDLKSDPSDEPPFNNGPNLYIRIYNRRHRVSVPFDQRSRGFIWFFSFLVWFDDAQAQAEAKTPIILLLDEPALSLHGLAQADFLDYIEDLGKAHQVIYTTHSPFMVRSDELDRVRVVEDRDNAGTTISERIDSSDPRSVFPLQAALGYTIAQNLFISERNLLVEGPADLLYLQAAAAALEEAGRNTLDSRITIVPVGGLDKVATFIALLRGNELKFAVCVDRATSPDQRLESLVREKLLHQKALLTYAMFRKDGGTDTDPTEVEDLFEVSHYVAMFASAYAKELGKTKVRESGLPSSTRIVDRLNQWLAAKSITLRANGGFNHFLVASRAVSSGLSFSTLELDAFEALFNEVNRLLL